MFWSFSLRRCFWLSITSLNFFSYAFLVLSFLSILVVMSISVKSHLVLLIVEELLLGRSNPVLELLLLLHQELLVAFIPDHKVFFVIEEKTDSPALDLDLLMELLD